MEAQVKLGCLELAAQLLKPLGDYDVNSVVNTATVLYNFCQASPQATEPVELADKPSKRKKPVSETDILT